MSEEVRESAFEALVAKLRKVKMEEPAPAPVGMPPLMHEFLRAFLVWEASPSKADKAMTKVLSSIVDLNELRICLPHEIIGIIGQKYPACEERAARLRSSLNDLFRREHDVSLDHLTAMPKRDARSYLESLEGTPPFVAARVSLLGLGAHAVPIDARLAGLLASEGVFPAGTDLVSVSSWLERRIRAVEARETYLQLESWSETQRKRPPAATAKGRSPKSTK